MPKYSKSKNFSRGRENLKRRKDSARPKRVRKAKKSKIQPKEDEKPKLKEAKDEINPSESDQEEEEEEEDYCTKLKQTFGKVKEIKAIFTSDEDSEDEEEEESILEEVKDTLETSEGEKIDQGETEEDNPQEYESEDPFNAHFCYDLSKSLLDSVQREPQLVKKISLNWPHLGTLNIAIPIEKENMVEKVKIPLIESERKFAQFGKIPTIMTLDKDKTLNEACIKMRIKSNVRTANESNLSAKESSLPFTKFQNEIFSIINNYQDLYFMERSFENGEEIRFAYVLHALNHVLKTRSKIVHHNAKIAKKEEIPDDFRDQGLVRPKVLIVVPFKDSALRIVRILTDLLFPIDKGNVQHKNRFMQDFSGGGLALPKKNPKPVDYEQTFAGNTDDTFKIGINVTKSSLKLYADFYSSDIIIASPLGLRLTIGAEGEAERDFDFLASVEVLVLDQADVFYMQNWEHVTHLMDHLHLQPRQAHGADFGRVRTWALDGLAKFYRQTLLFASVQLAEVNAVCNRRCFNFAGKVRLASGAKRGSVCQVGVPLPQVLSRVPLGQEQPQQEARFAFFKHTLMLDQFRDRMMRQTLIYVPQYFDYVRIRNYLREEGVSFVQICEYSKDEKVARARDMFFHGEAHFLLYSERFHYFRRVRIKGIRHIIFYQPPTIPHFYAEMCNLMQESNMNTKVGSSSNMTVTIVYTKYDLLRLAAIIGTEKAVQMVDSDRDVHMFVSGENST